MAKEELKLSDLLKELENLSDSQRIKVFQRFFKTGKGQYGEGDRFLGITVPKLRTTAKRYVHLQLPELEKLIKNPYHEARLVCLLILTYQYSKASTEERETIYRFYLDHTKFINNWDLVDLSADKIAGAYLDDKDKTILTKLARSENLWERRIAILSTFHFIKKVNSAEALRIAELLVNDRQDLIQKAVGWMLREIGKRCGENTEDEFLGKHYKTMPRTMLRYAIERMDEAKRRGYLKGERP